MVTLVSLTLLFVGKNRSNTQQRFEFARFNIHHARSAWKVTTDSIILGAWADCTGRSSALDIGCGSGLLALLLASRYVSLALTGVEIHQPSVLDAQMNVAASPYSDRIEIVGADIHEYAASRDARWDMIVCNPPYFTTGISPRDPERELARFGSAFNLFDLARLSEKRCSIRMA